MVPDKECTQPVHTWDMGPFDFLCILKWDGARLSRCLCRRKFYSRVNIPHDCFLVLQKVHTSVSLSVGSFLELSWVRRRRDESVSEREKNKTTITFFKFQEAQNLKVHQASLRLKWLAKAEIFSKSNKYQPPILGPRQKWLKSQKRRQLGHKLWGAAENRDL